MATRRRCAKALAMPALPARCASPVPGRWLALVGVTTVTRRAVRAWAGGVLAFEDGLAATMGTGENEGEEEAPRDALGDSPAALPARPVLRPLTGEATCMRASLRARRRAAEAASRAIREARSGEGTTYGGNVDPLAAGEDSGPPALSRAAAWWLGDAWPAAAAACSSSLSSCEAKLVSMSDRSTASRCSGDARSCTPEPESASSLASAAPRNVPRCWRGLHSGARVFGEGMRVVLVIVPST